MGTIQLNYVLEGKTDFGINFIGGEDPGIDFQPLLTEHYVLVARKDHPLALRESVGWEELAGEKLIGVSQRSGNRLLLDHHLANLPVRPRVFYEASHLHGAYGMAMAGMGVMVVPELSLTPTYAQMLAGIALRQPQISRTVGLITRVGYKPSATISRLIDLIRQEFNHYSLLKAP